MSSKGIVASALLLAVVAGTADLWLRLGVAGPQVRQAAAARVEAVPTDIGAWHGAPTTFDDLVVRLAGCWDYKSVRYENMRSGDVARMTLMAGPAGEMCEHLPETCYAAAGWTLQQSSHGYLDLDRLVGDGAAGRLAVMDFVDAKGSHVRVWQGWFDGRRWDRPDYARLHYVGADKLYRLMVEAPITADPFDLHDRAGRSGGESFLADVLPAIDRILTAPLPAEPAAGVPATAPP